MESARARSQPILIVDGDPATLELVSTTLQKVGYSVRTASNYRDAIISARKEEPLVAVIDVELPGRSGYELFKALRDDFGDGLPVIFMSGVRTQPVDRVAGLLAGGDDYVVKPFDPEELVARLRAVLRRTSAG